jgi:hypothetical protein
MDGSAVVFAKGVHTFEGDAGIVEVHVPQDVTAAEVARAVAGIDAGAEDCASMGEQGAFAA